MPSQIWQSPSPTARSLAGLSPGAGPEAEQGAVCKSKGMQPPPRLTLGAGTQAKTAVCRGQGHLQDALSCTE